MPRRSCLLVAVPLIHNPRSASGRGAKLAEKAARLLAERGVQTRPIATYGPMDAGAKAAQLAKAGESRVLVIGGDGTLSEACDGILSGGHDITLGFLPGGTGNSLLRDFGLTTLEAAADAIAAGDERRIDAARATWDGGSRHFVNVFGTGFMAKVCDLANARYKWMGGASYSWAVFPELTRLSSPRTRLVLDGKVVEERFGLVSVCNSKHTGGGMLIAPQAESDDGLLDVVALHEVSRGGLLRIFPRIFKGTHIGHERVFSARAREIRIEPDEESPLLGDGEVYGRTPVEIRVLPGAVRALLPRFKL